jgi:trimeric autotransporter adhesin
MRKDLMRLTLFRAACLVAFVFSASWIVAAQRADTSASAPVSAPVATVPTLINFNGVLSDPNSKPLSGKISGVTFLLYRDQQGGAPLWMETQNVTSDKLGHYTATLGSTTAEGLPADIFSSGQARWLAIQIAGQPEQPRVLLVAVPYALKAADAQTLGGLPPSAFVLATPGSTTEFPAPVGGPSTQPSGLAPSSSSNVTTTGGTVKALPLWTSATNVQSSAITQAGSGVSAKIGINTVAPAAALDVKGATIVRGLFSLPALAPATAAAGKSSQPASFTASAFNSASTAAVNQNFRLQAEATGNNTANSSATLNLLFAQGAAAPVETGLKLASNGRIIFAPGQTFPGTGNGTVKSVALSAPGEFNVTGSPVTTNGTLGFVWKVQPTSLNIANAIIQRDAAGNFGAGKITSGAINSATSTETIGIAALNGVIGGVGVAGTVNASTGENFGVLGSNYSTSDFSSGVYGVSLAQSNFAFTLGVLGQSGSAFGAGVFGYGVTLSNTSSSLSGTLPSGVWGDTNSSFGAGVTGTAGADSNAFYGENNSAGFPTAFFTNDANNALVFKALGNGGFCQSDTFGDLLCTGTISASSAVSKIDNPIDPANKYLIHRSIESPEAKTVYDGVTLLDGNGEAWVRLPAYLEALNQDFRYQLTAIGAPGPNLYVAEKISGHRFRIAGGKPGAEVSWQVTGIRHDAWTNASAEEVEPVKSPVERGYYLHPEAFGQPREKGITALHAQRHKTAAQSRPPNAPAPRP